MSGQLHPAILLMYQCPADTFSIVVKPGPDILLKEVFEAFSTVSARASWRERLLFMPWVSLQARAAADQKYQLGCMAVSL